MKNLSEINKLTMSSVEIAELTGKRHDNVLADIKRILSEAEIDALGFEGIYKDSMNREKPCYNLPRLECDLVITGYSVPYRHAIIKRWHELEEKVRPMTRIEMAKQYYELLLAEEALQIELDKANEWYSLKRAEKVTGLELKWQLLKSISLEHGYEVKKVFDQNYGYVNAYHVDVYKISYPEIEL